jgi:hypothetical protein
LGPGSPLIAFSIQNIFGFFRRCTLRKLMKKKPLSKSGTEIMFGNIYGLGHSAQEMDHHLSVRQYIICPNLQELTYGRSVK